MSANGLAFQTSDAWGAGFTNDLFVTEFGNFFGTEVVGHEIVRVELDESGTQVVRQSEFLSGAAPLDVAFGPDGSMFVADLGGTIYRVAQVAAIPPVDVQMAVLEFVPAAVTIPQGGVVRFVNSDPVGAPHNAIGQTSLKVSGQGNAEEIHTATFGPGSSEEVRLDEPGIYKYICSVHPATMHGAILVVPSGG